jgi:hypothetical protein
MILLYSSLLQVSIVVLILSGACKDLAASLLSDDKKKDK